MDPSVRRILEAWSRSKDTDLGWIQLKAGFGRLSPRRREELCDRLAEVALGMLYVVESESEPAGG